MNLALNLHNILAAETAILDAAILDAQEPRGAIQEVTAPVTHRHRLHPPVTLSDLREAAQAALRVIRPRTTAPITVELVDGDEYGVVFTAAGEEPAVEAEIVTPDAEQPATQQTDDPEEFGSLKSGEAATEPVRSTEASETQAS